jgi:hypothetical protein
MPAAAETGRLLLHDWQAASGRHAALQGIAKVRVQTAERTLNATQVLLVEAPDRLRAETLSPFGTPLLVIATDGTTLSVLQPGDNLFYAGQASAENLRRFTRLPLHPADLVDILLARPPVIAHRQLATFRLPDGGWRVELSSATRGQHLVFDAARRLREVIYLQGQEPLLRLAYGEPITEAQTLPRQIDLDLPGQETSASLVFTELADNGPVPPGAFTLRPPAGATVVRLDEVAASGGEVTPDLLPGTRPKGE